MDPNQNQPQQVPQSSAVPLQDVQPQTPTPSPLFDQFQPAPQPIPEAPIQALTQPMPSAVPVTEPIVLASPQAAIQTPMQTTTAPELTGLMSTPTPAPAPSVVDQPVSQPMPLTPQVVKKSKKKLIIIATAVLLAIAAITVSLLLFVFNGSAEEKAFRSFIGAYNDKNCSKAVSYMAPSVYEGQTKDEFVKECEDNKNIVFDVTGIEVVSVKKISGDDKKATLEAVERKDSEEKTATVSLVKVDGDWLVEDIETN